MEEEMRKKLATEIARKVLADEIGLRHPTARLGIIQDRVYDALDEIGQPYSYAVCGPDAETIGAVAAFAWAAATDPSAEKNR